MPQLKTPAVVNPSLLVIAGFGFGLQVFGVTDIRWVPHGKSMLDVFSNPDGNTDTDLDNLTAALVETQDRLVALQN